MAFRPTRQGSGTIDRTLDSDPGTAMQAGSGIAGAHGQMLEILPVKVMQRMLRPLVSRGVDDVALLVQVQA